MWTILALAATGVVLVVLFEAYVEPDLRMELEGSFNRVIALIDPEAGQPTLRGDLADPRYDTQFSGFYWQVLDQRSGEAVRSRSLWDETLPTAVTEALGNPASLSVVAGPAGQSLDLLSQIVQFDTASGSRTYTVSVARDRAPLLASQTQFTRDMSIALAVVAIALVAAAWVLVNIGLAPLHRIAATLDAIRGGAKMDFDERRPSEVEPLIKSLRELIAANEQALESARKRASDLAHGLKTPLAVVVATADRLKAAGDDAHAETLSSVADEMVARVDYQLRLSRLRQRTSAQSFATPLHDAVVRTVSVLRKTHHGEALHWQVELVEERLLDIDQHDLSELIGILLDNAAKWATSVVTVSSHGDGGRAGIIVEDDGPGLSLELIAKLGPRGLRFDESRSGSGLGIAIAREIVAANDGTIEISRADRGGLRVKFALPISSRTPS